MERKSLPFECKIDTDERTFSGYAAVFGNVDLGGDRVLQGAFKKTISERMPKDLIKVLWQHWHPLGMPLDLKEDKHGLWFNAKVSDTAEGRDRLTYMRDKVVNQMSFGYDVIKYEWDEEKEQRDLIELKLYEISPVTFPMNEATSIDSVKEFISKAPLNDPITAAIMWEKMFGAKSRPDVASKSVVRFQNLPLAGKTREFDSRSAFERVKTWAKATDAPTAELKKAFLWYDSEKADKFEGYKECVLIADLVGGELKAIPNAIIGIAKGISQGQEKLEDLGIPKDDFPAIKRHISKYYKEMSAEFDDDSIRVPWGKSDALISKVSGIEKAIQLLSGELSELKQALGEFQPVTTTENTTEPQTVDETKAAELFAPFRNMLKEFQA